MGLVADLVQLVLAVPNCGFARRFLTSWVDFELCGLLDWCGCVFSLVVVMV